jgi:N-acetyl-gamma-glutamyl-phosphate reductase
MFRVGIIGGAGYTAGELLRLLINHPDIEISFVHSASNGGGRVTDVHGGLTGETDLVFSAEVSPLGNCDALFLCSSHGDSRKFFELNDISEGTKVIDLSTDYRHRETAEGFVYGLPELNRSLIIGSNRVANPGCFATAIQLALLPLAAAGRVGGEVHVHAVTGSTGAGVRPSASTHFSWRNNNLSVYKPFRHQHLKEITESLQQLQPSFSSPINFIPLRGDFSRGIFACVYTESDLSAEEAGELYRGFYSGAAFTFVTDYDLDMKQVVNTNKCLLNIGKHGNKLLITSVIDNLLKGASGQAVQNFNLMFGLDERTGLRLKATGF